MLHAESVANPFEVMFSILSSIRNEITELNTKISKLQPSQETDTIGLEEVAKILNLAPRTVYNKTYKKLIPHTKKGKKIIFSRERILQYLAEGEVKTFHDEFRESERLIKEKIASKSTRNFLQSNVPNTDSSGHNKTKYPQ